MIATQADLPPLTAERFARRYPAGPRRQWAIASYGAMLAEARKLARPAYLFSEFGLSDVRELAEWLPEKTVSVVLAVCTIGPHVEQHIRELFPEEPADAVILDEICLALVSGLARNIHALIREKAMARGLRAGPPYRAGIGRWPLEVQRTVFDHLPTHKIDVSLDEHLIMRPLKSTSLIIPLLDKREAKGGSI